MLRRDVLKCLVLGLFSPALTLKSSPRIQVTIYNHSDTDPFVVEIKGDVETIFRLRLEIREYGKFRGLSEMQATTTLVYYVTNQAWEDVFLTILERYKNVDYKVQWDTQPGEVSDPQDDLLDKGISLTDWLVG